jgi:excisionase family DNA binding protein
MEKVPGVLPDLVTTREAAVALRVTETTVRRWIESGELPATRVGKRILRIPRTALSRFAGSEATNAQ